jgi:hypothetical protein
VNLATRRCIDQAGPHNLVHERISHLLAHVRSSTAELRACPAAVTGQISSSLAPHTGRPATRVANDELWGSERKNAVQRRLSVLAAGCAEGGRRMGEGSRKEDNPPRRSSSWLLAIATQAEVGRVVLVAAAAAGREAQVAGRQHQQQSMVPRLGTIANGAVGPMDQAPAETGSQASRCALATYPARPPQLWRPPPVPAAGPVVPRRGPSATRRRWGATPSEAADTSGSNLRHKWGTKMREIECGATWIVCGPPTRCRNESGDARVVR